MRKVMFKFVGKRSLAEAFALSRVMATVLWLAAFSCCFAVCRASVTPAGTAERSGQQGGHSRSRRHIRKRIRPARRIVSTSARKPVRRRRRTRRATRTQRYRLAATLDSVRTHGQTIASRPDSAEQGPAPAGEHPELPRPLALTVSDTSSGAGADETAQPALQESAGSQSLNARDLPAFHVSIPRYMPIPLRGSHEVLVHQNLIADVEGLRRIENDAQLGEMVRTGDLVALPASAALSVDSRLPMNRRYCRPWTAKFLSDLSRAHQSAFGRPLQLTSAVRTVQFQRHLARYNGNAAPAFGDTASPHLTGQAIDLGKKGMTQREVAWMRTILGQLQSSGRLDVEEEFEQACFHISVYKTYAPRSASTAHLVARNEPPAPQIAATQPVIAGLARPAAARIVRTGTARASRYSSRTARRTATRRRRRRRHSGMALLAVQMR